MMIAKNIPPKTALLYAGILAAGVIIGLIIPTHSPGSTAVHVNAPLTKETKASFKTYRVVRVVEEPVEAQLDCGVSETPKDPIAAASKDKFIYVNGKNVITKICRPRKDEAAKMPNLFKK